MNMRRSLTDILLNDPSEILLMDGGQGTELENRGIDISGPVWSTVPFLKRDFWLEDVVCPERIIIKEMFEAYINSGSRILSTITYQTSFKTIVEHTDLSTLEEYHQLLSRIVSFCRECVGMDQYLVGCIGPYAAHIAAEYSGYYGVDPQSIDYLSYFEPQLSIFNKNEAIDIIGFETVPNKFELEAILSWDEKVISKAFYISLSMDDDLKLRDGTTMNQICSLFKDRPAHNSNLVMMGINCCTLECSLKILEDLHRAIPDLPLIVYPNSGECYDTKTQTWSNRRGIKLPTWGDLIKGYTANGARIIGGCCRTTPADIQEMERALKQLPTTN